MITINIMHGRPVMKDVANVIADASIPGVFFCGPSALLASVKEEVERERGGIADRCSYYVEEFEM